MNIDWLHNHHRKKLIIFCNGWGMDSEPFRSIDSSDYDVLNLYNFKDFHVTDQCWDFFSRYAERILVGWSMGVWVGQRLFDSHKDLFSRTIAINGTLCPIDNRYGIPRDMFNGTMEAWSELSRQKFYSRLCGRRDVRSRFLESSPARTLTDQQDELKYYLDNVDCLEPAESIYNEIVVGDKDRIVPTDHQIEYWGSRNITIVRGSHFLFYTWKSWDHMMTEFNAYSR